MRAIGRVPDDAHYDASLTAPCVKNVVGGPGNREVLPQVEANAVALGMLSQLSFGNCTSEDRAPEEFVEKMTRCAGRYGLGHGFKWPSSRMREFAAEGDGVLPGHPVELHLAGVDSVQDAPGRVDGQARRGAVLPELHVGRMVEHVKHVPDIRAAPRRA